MMMQMDVLTVVVGFVSFGVFLAVHVVTFRWLRPEELLRSLLACVVAIIVFPLALMGELLFGDSLPAGPRLAIPQIHLDLVLIAFAPRAFPVRPPHPIGRNGQVSIDAVVF